MTGLRVHRTGVLAWALLVTTVACSSPTSPSRPPTQQPPPGDQRPPLSLACPANQSLTATNASGVTVSFTAPVVSGGVAPVQTSCTPASGSTFAVGNTTVRCNATDAAQATASCTFTVTVAAPAPRVSRTKFLAFGDSMTLGEVTQPTGVLAQNGTPLVRLIIVPSAAYPTQLLTLLRARYTAQTSTLQMFNAGRPGEWAEDGALRLPAVLANERPEVVLLLQGANDLGALGTPGVQRAWRAIDTMAKEVRNRGARLFLATLPPTRTTGVNAIPNTLIQSLNANIRTTAQGEGAVLVDLNQALASDVNRYVGIDGLHPTEAGYQRIAETFFAAIRAALETP
jgi:lysophospholipase L1-like esterase